MMSDDADPQGSIVAQVASVPVWFHSIDLGHGVVTPGSKPVELLAAEFDALRLPDLRGRSVLDIGTWDGYHAFAAERLGAERVVALDHYVWFMDLVAQRDYWAECRLRGVTPLPADEVDEIWRPQDLPGKVGFDTAKRVLGSRVEEVVGDFMTMDLDELGVFDVVLFLGVLYHVQDPLLALRRLREITGELAIIETAYAVVPGADDHPMWEFFPSDELNGDPTNWWAPNLAGLVAACRAVGFSDVEILTQSPPGAPPNAGHEWHYGRTIVHAHAG